MECESAEQAEKTECASALESARAHESAEPAPREVESAPDGGGQLDRTMNGAGRSKAATNSAQDSAKAAPPLALSEERLASASAAASEIAAGRCCAGAERVGSAGSVETSATRSVHAASGARGDGCGQGELLDGQEGHDAPQQPAAGSGLIGDAGDGWEEREGAGKGRGGNGARKGRVPASGSGSGGRDGGGGKKEGGGGRKRFVPAGFIDGQDSDDGSFSDHISMPWSLSPPPLVPPPAISAYLEPPKAYYVKARAGKGRESA